MRLKFEFELKDKEIPLDYRRVFISFFKNAMEKNNEGEKEKYYKNNDPIVKAFTFSVLLDNPKFSRDKIDLNGNSIALNFSTASYEIGINYYNALVKMLNKSYPLINGNSITLKSILMVKEANVFENEINVRVMSPIIVREHQKDKNFDLYLMPKDTNYIKFLKNNIENSIKNVGCNELLEDINTFSITENITKEVKVFFYGHKFNGLIGTLKMQGTNRLLDFIIKSGLGSRTSSGFGMMEVM